MKYCITLLAILLTFNAFAQNDNPQQAQVEEVAQNFIKLIFIEEYDQAKKSGTPETIKILDEMKAMKKRMSKKEKKEMKQELSLARKSTISFTKFDFKEKSNHNSCTVNFTMSNAPNKTEEIYLEQTNANWLVNLKGPKREEVAATKAVESEKKALEAIEKANDAAEKAAQEATDAVEKAADAVEEVVDIADEIIE